MEALDALHTPQRPSPVVSALDARIEALNFRFYLSQLNPPMTVQQSAQSEYRFTGVDGKPVTQDDAFRRREARKILPQTRDFLRVMLDSGLFDAKGLE